jgi:ketosteroid isomerase-like protein
MGAAIDWLEAYRARNIESILAMYADDAVVHCGCGGLKKFSGKDGLRAYWLEPIRNCPAFNLDDIQLLEGGAVVSDVTLNGVVCAELTFDTSGRWPCSHAAR